MPDHAPPPNLISPDRADPSLFAVTLNLADEQEDCLLPNVALLRDCVAAALQRWKFEVTAAVVLPRGVELLLRFDGDRSKIELIIKVIQTTFAVHAGATGVVWAERAKIEQVPVRLSQLRAGYIEEAPVRADLVLRATDWPYSSIHKVSDGSPLRVPLAC